MNDFIPTKVRDVTESKQRVMRNVVNEIESKSRKPKRKWQYVVITAILTMGVFLFLFNELVIENELHSTDVQSPTKQHLDFNKPTFLDEQGTYYLHGLTLGDSQSKVIEFFGEKYTIEHEEGSEADLIMDYDGQARFYIKEDQLDSIVFMNVDEAYYEKLFNSYDGFKFIYDWFFDNDNRLFYSKVTAHMLRATAVSNDANLQLSLFYAESDHWEEKAEFLYMLKQNLNNGQQSLTNLNIDLAKPTFSDEQGYLYFNGVTLGDPPSKVIERLGNNYILGKADMGGADFFIEYEGKASFYFYNDKLRTIIFTKVDKDYFDELFTSYDGLKLIDSARSVDSDRYFYSKETGQIVKATTNTPNNDLYLYLTYAGKDLLENPDFPGEQF